MHARELVELAALAANHGPLLIESRIRPPDEAVGQYWSASKCRLDRWGRTLKSLRHATSDETWIEPSGKAAPVVAPRGYLRSVLEEIVTAEILTRVWTAVLVGCDRKAEVAEAEPVARNVLAGQLEARHRALTFLLEGPGVSSHDALALNHLRRRAERWSDLLVGRLAAQMDLTEFAPNPSRAAALAADFRRQGSGASSWSMLLAALRAAFGSGLAPMSPNQDLNREIGASVLASFPTKLFDSTGMLQSLWMSRLSRADEDSQQVIHELFDASGPIPASARSGAISTSHRRLFGGQA